MSSDIDYESATRRVFRFAFALAIAGTLIAGFMRGVPDAVGFALGAGASLVSLSLWRRVATRISPSEEPRKSGPSTLFLAGRFLALFACAYVIVKTLEVNVMAALSGLFVSAAAVVAEVLFELITFRHSRSR
jgi:hypothetical protein